MADFKIINAHVLTALRSMPDESVHCVVTSPPYWGLRSYGTEPQVWGGVSECLHLWGEVGPDHHPGQVEQTKWKTAQAAGQGQTSGSGQFCVACAAWRGELGGEPTPELFVEHTVEIFREVRRVLRADGTLWLNIGDSYANDTKWGGATGGKHASGLHGGPIGRGRRFTGLKGKDLVGAPWMLAFALRADGWYLRMDNVWAKRNCMPESVTDRPTKSHEYVFLMSKSETYYYDHEAIMEPLQTSETENYPARAHATGSGDQGFAAARGNDRGKSGGFPPSKRSGNKERKLVVETRPNDHRGSSIPWEGNARNKRSVWTINTTPFPGAHFAVMPEELAEVCILAGSPAGGTVLDPFTGSGTVAVVALRHGRNFVGAELNPKYHRMAHRRIFRAAPLTTTQPADMDEPHSDLPLFQESSDGD